MRTWMLSALLLSCTVTVVAQPADPVHAPACVQALAALKDVEDALGAQAGSEPAAGGDRQPLRERLRALQRRAASVCLGSAAAPASAAQRVPAAPAGREPMRTAAPGVTPPASAASPPGRVRTAPAPAPAPVLSIVSCDAAGCWASDGTRLQRSGTLLLGPRGYCSASGSVLNCP